jgi:pyridoxamine 5'-phosphate oxidase
VRIEGFVERLPDAESDDYFASRPLDARRSAAASAQSELVSSREELEARVAALAEADVARPARWGGYLLVPGVYEFWQHRESRLHDRLRYRRDGRAWVLERLAP